MNNKEIAAAGIGRASRWLQGAKRAMEDERWDNVVYDAQMTVEQASKSVLFALAIDFPRTHDVSDVFTHLSERRDLPAWFRERVPSISNTIAELAEQRGLAAYGYERGIDKNYFKEYAAEAFEKAKEVYDLCEKLLRQIFPP